MRFLLVALLAVVILAPTLGMGFYADDCLHQTVLERDDPRLPMRPWALFDFGTRADWAALDGEVGSFPWWTGEDWHARFFRPLSSLVRWAQFEVFGRWAPGYHLVGIASFVLLLVAVRRFYLRLGLGESAAGLGSLLVAVSHTAVLPASWPANANSLWVALCSVGAMTVLLAPGEPSGRRLLGGITLAAAAALAKESGIVALALASLVCAARARSAGSGRRRLAVAAGCALVLALGHLAWIRIGGYGTNSLFYATPWVSPARFARNLGILVATGPLAMVAPFPVDAIELVPVAAVPLVLVGLALGAPIVLWVTRTVRGRPGAGWLALWTGLFLVVQAGVMPSGRLLLLPAIGAAGLLAAFFVCRRERAPSDPGSKASRAAARALFLSATVGSGLFALIQSSGMTWSSRFLRESVLATEVGPASLGHRSLFVLQAPNQMLAFALHTTWGQASADHDLTFHLLQGGARPIRWTRTGEGSFELESLGVPFLALPFERVYLSDSEPFEVGERRQSSGLQVEVLGVEAGLPTRLGFTLPVPPDDPRVGFLVAEGARLVRTPTLRVGESRSFATPTHEGPWVP